MLTLKFFASCADTLGRRQETAAFAPSPRKLVESSSELSVLKGMRHLRVAVNREWAEWDTPLRDGDEVAFLPPVSGG